MKTWNPVWCLLVILAVSGATTLDGQSVSARPELVSGLWEVAVPSGVDGISISVTTRQVPGGKPADQTIQVRAYQRRGGFETSQSYVVSPPANDSTAFDGTRLRVAGLTATFDPTAARWTGTWLKDGETRNVVLARPAAATGVASNPLCGEWEGSLDMRASAPTRLHITQSADGIVSAWMDRRLATADQRHGESVKVVAVDRSSVTLTMNAAVGPVARYVGKLSQDAGSLEGEWTNLNAQSNFQRVR